jgi:hypothetical protein
MDKEYYANAANHFLINKLNVVIVIIAKNEWTTTWPNFISELCNSSKSDPNLCENNMKLLILLSEEMSQNNDIRIEIACDKDIHFYYICDINLQLFEEIKKNQKLTCNYDQFSDLLIKFLDLCIKETKKYLAVFLIKENGEYKMELFENLEYKFGDLISLDFTKASDDLIKKQINYRYNTMRAYVDMAKDKIKSINGVLKDVDPDLIYEVKKNVSKVKPELYLRDTPIIEKP